MRFLFFADVHAPFVLHLTDGRPVLLDEFVQYRTYSGLLLGLPDERRVSMIVEQTIERASRQFGGDPAPHVLDYELVDYEQAIAASRLAQDGSLSPVDQEPQRSTGRRLPLVTCIASFMRPVTVKAPEGIGVFASSIATIIWFQESFGPPFGGEITERIRILDWAAVAVDISD